MQKYLFLALIAFARADDDEGLRDGNKCQEWKTNLMVIRHGASEANLAGSDERWTVDTPLASPAWCKKYANFCNSTNQTGFEQASVELRSNVNNYCAPEILIISPMRRTIQTAFEGFHDFIKNNEIEQIVLDRRVREIYHFVDQNKGTPTSKWSKGFFDPWKTKPDIDIYAYLKKLPNLGFKDADAKSQWNQVAASVDDMKDTDRLTQFKADLVGLADKRVAVVSHWGAIHEIWHEPNPKNAEPIFY